MKCLIRMFGAGLLLATFSLLACIGFAACALQLASSLFCGMRAAIVFRDARPMQPIKPQRLLV